MSYECLKKSYLVQDEIVSTLLAFCRLSGLLQNIKMKCRMMC